MVDFLLQTDPGIKWKTFVPVFTDFMCFGFCFAERRLGEAAVVRLPLDQCWKTGICGESAALLHLVPTHSLKKHFPALWVFLSNAYSSDDETQTPPGLWWWASWSGSWKSLRNSPPSVLPFYLSLAIPLELIRDLGRLAVPTCSYTVYKFYM